MVEQPSAKRVIIIGGGYAGLKAALRLGRKLQHQPIDVLLVNGADHFVERIRLHQLASDQSLPKIPFQRIVRGTGVQFLQGWVTQVAPEQKTVTVQTADVMERAAAHSISQRIGYDYLVYALGSFIDTQTVPGAAEYALSLSTEATALQLRERLPDIAAHGGRVVICGGGLTGIESTTELAEAYPALKLTLVTKGAFGAQLSKRGQAYVRKAFARRGIDVIDHATLTQIMPDRVEYDGGGVPYDLCLWSAGFKTPSLAREAGLQVNARGQIMVDEHLRSVSHPDIYAVGDSAGLEEALDIPIRMACATSLPMATYAADHIAATLKGEARKPYQFAYIIRCISLGRHDGLVQMVERDDTPREQILTGRLAAQVKEMICQYAANIATQSERWLPGGVVWAGARPAATTRQVQTSP